MMSGAVRIIRRVPLRINYLTLRSRAFTDEIQFRPEDVMIPPYEDRINETLEKKRARLLYQSRKRGMLENGLLLSTFAALYLNDMNDEQLKQYDKLINKPSNDWDIYYWATGVKPTPLEFDNEIMDKFKDHVKNKERTLRIRQPDLEFPT